MSFLQKMKDLVVGTKLPSATKRLTERQLIELESKIGGQLFGSIPDGHKRDFFCLDERTWVWHEEWRDEDNKVQTSTVRYEVQPNGILKVQPGRVYKYIEGEELENLSAAVRLYYEYSMRRIYCLDPVTGKPLTPTPPATI
jgi:hypothetical protein